MRSPARSISPKTCCDFAYITAITNISYFKGLCMLLRSFKKTKSKIPFFVMIPTESDTRLKNMIAKLAVDTIECEWIDIDLDMQRGNKVPSWNQTFFKLNIMRLTQFKKIIFVDADMLILNNIDHLFEYPSISATTGGKSANPEWNEFNSGLMVVEPSIKEFTRLISCIMPSIKRKIALDLGYGDQDVFNEFYPQWKNEPDHHIDETYNAEYCYLDALMRAKGYTSLSRIHVLHFIGRTKIWNHSFLYNLRLLHACIHEKRIYEARALLLYLRYLYF